MNKGDFDLPDWEFRVISPGRVNLLGEHVDYNQGLVLPIAIDRSIHLAVRPRGDSLVSIEARDLGQSVCFDLTGLEQKLDSHGKPLPEWALYPAGVAWALQKAGYEPGGLDAVLASDLPRGAGLSSSAALELAFALAWQTIGGIEMDRMRLAQLCQQAENRYVGVNCGLMDQFACAHGVARHALYFDTRSLAWQPLPMPPRTAVVVVDSGIRRSLSASAYNLRREECDQAVSLLQEKLPGIRALRDVTPAQLQEFGGCLPEDVRKRAQHVVEEIERVRRACAFLVADNAPEFGRLMAAGHISLRDLFEVSLPDLDRLVEYALEIEGCYGARLTGAGFGGCTVNLVDSDCAEAFMQELAARSHKSLDREVSLYLCRPNRGAHLAGK